MCVSWGVGGDGFAGIPDCLWIYRMMMMMMEVYDCEPPLTQVSRLSHTWSLLDHCPPTYSCLESVSWFFLSAFLFWISSHVINPFFFFFLILIFFHTNKKKIEVCLQIAYVNVWSSAIHVMVVRMTQNACETKWIWSLMNLDLGQICTILLNSKVITFGLDP